MLLRLHIGIFLSLTVTAAAAQEVPPTDIFVMEMPTEAVEEFLEPENITGREGYDNQPAFSADGTALYFSSIWDDEQSDVYRLRLRAGVHQRLTFTPESEYSPTPLPDGTGFSVIRVESDGTQRLWKFSPDGRAAELLLADLAPVGYHAWISDDLVALFVLGEPHQLVIAGLSSGRRDTVASDIGRSLHRVPGQDAVSYVQKRAGVWTIDIMDVETRSVRSVAAALPGQEDFAWVHDGTLLSADRNVIYALRPGEEEWSAWLDFSHAEAIGTISRIAVSARGNMLAFVAERRRH